MLTQTDQNTTRLRLLTSLAQASTSLGHGETDASRLHDPDLASSISAVRLQSHDLMRRRMKELRRAAGLTQAQLAERAGVPRRAISDFESGRAIVADLVSTIAPVLGLPDSIQPALAQESSVVRRARTAVAGEQTVEFEVVASGISMEPSVRHGDVLLVSPDVALLAGRVVVAKHGETWIVKRLAERDGALVLRSDNAEEEVTLTEVEIQGTVVELRRSL
ncbi:MAG: LexA family transcriptional regulator [Dehalococcoidia bacterium]